MADPLLPPEIEHLIFINAFKCVIGNEEHMLHLLLVAKRVHTWLIPELMRTIALRIVPKAQTYPKGLDIQLCLQRYGEYTRNLFLWVTSIYHNGLTPDDILSLCPNVANLVLWTDDQYVPRHHLANLPLTHLSINLANSNLEFTPELVQLFSNITHLEVTAFLKSERDIDLVKPFTSLTHLAISEGSGHPLFPLLFKALPKLRILISLDGGDWTHTSMTVIGHFDPEKDDPRVVRLVCKCDMEVKEWLDDIHERSGIWSMAEGVVHERLKIHALSA